METNNQLVIIRKIEKYIEYMLTILIKLPITEKFSSPRNVIAREIVLNTLMHRDITPFAKNPTIAKFFREIGYADELGSGQERMDIGL